MIWVNGRPAEWLHDSSALQLFSNAVHGTPHAGTMGLDAPPLPRWDVQVPGIANAVRLGEVSDLGLGPFPRNYSADMTLDEFYLWRILTPFSLNDGELEMGQGTLIQREVIELRKKAVLQWAEGRYYRPREDASFMSAPIRMDGRDRSLSISADYKKTTTRGGPSQTRTRLLGMAWTCIPEEISRKDGKGIVLDYRPRRPGEMGSNEDFIQEGDDATPELDAIGGTTGVGFVGARSFDEAPHASTFRWNEELEKMAPYALKQDFPSCSVILKIVGPGGRDRRVIAGVAGMGYSDDGFSVPIDAGTGTQVELSGDDCLQYVILFKIQGARSDSILLGSPVFDDITFYLARDEVDLLSWSGADKVR